MAVPVKECEYGFRSSRFNDEELQSVLGEHLIQNSVELGFNATERFCR